LSEYGDKISADAKVSIETALTELKDAHQKKDVDAINKALEAINNAWAAATQNMNPNAGQEQNTQQGPQDDQSQVTDVDFEEVK
jgi:molecular chaperone DnaK